MKQLVRSLIIKRFAQYELMKSCRLSSESCLVNCNPGCSSLKSFIYISSSVNILLKRERHLRRSFYWDDSYLQFLMSSALTGLSSNISSNAVSSYSSIVDYFVFSDVIPINSLTFISGFRYEILFFPDV